MNWASLTAFFTAAGTCANLFILFLQKDKAADDKLTKDKKDLLDEFKIAYSSHNVGMAVDALRRLRESK